MAGTSKIKLSGKLKSSLLYVLFFFFFFFVQKRKYIYNVLCVRWFVLVQTPSVVFMLSSTVYSYGHVETVN